MIGFFSFRDWSVTQAIDYWMGFLKRIGITPDYITIHPDKPEWSKFYDKYGVEVRLDEECIWSDGEIGGYCTEFYKDDIEIGNIVNPLGNCIDVGFGLERIEMVLNNTPKSKEDTLKETVFKMIESGFAPGNNKQGYILKKLLRLCHKNGVTIDHDFYRDEVVRQEKILVKWERLKDKHKDKPKEWWWDTHGIDLDLI
jgi:alanyl-tRNA synthetase